MFAHAGSFSSPTATGNATVSFTPASSFTPKVVIVWGTTNAGAFRSSLGVATGAAAEWALSFMALDNAAAANNAGGLVTDAVVRVINGSAAALVTADFVSFGADQFTLNWTTVAASGRTFYYLALGGTDLSVEAGNFALTTTEATQAVTTAFQPKAVMLCASQRTASGVEAGDVQLSFGMMDSARQWVGSTWQDDAAGTSDTLSGVLTNAVLRRIDAAGAAVEQADFNAFGATSFTLDTPTRSAALLVGYLALGGTAKIEVGTFNQSTAGAPVSQEVNLAGAFQPVALLLGSPGKAAGAASADMKFSVGAASAAATENFFSNNDEDNQATMQAAVDHGTDGIINFIDGGATVGITVAAEADLASLDTDGFTLNWSVTDATARVIGYLVLGSAGGTTFEQALSATATVTATAAKGIDKIVAATANATAALLKAVTKAFSATATVTATLTALKVVLKAMTATAAASAALAREVAKGLAASASGAATTIKSVAKTLAASASGSATLARLIGKVIAAAVSGAAALAADLIAALASRPARYTASDAAVTFYTASDGAVTTWAASDTDAA